MKSLIFLSFLLSQSFAQDIIASVGNEVITLKEFEKAYQEQQLFLSPKKITKKSVLMSLIDRLIGIKKAKEQKLADNEIVLKKMEDVLFHAQISKDLEQEFKKIVVTKEDVQTYYKENPEYRTAHILLRLRANPSNEEVEAAYKQLMKVYQELKDDETRFSELASKYSQSPSASMGGDIGHQPAIRLAPSYFAAIHNKKLGTLTYPVRTQFGLHLIKLLDKKSADKISLPLYKKIVYDIKRDKIIQAHFRKQRAQSDVKINVELLKNF